MSEWFGKGCKFLSAKWDENEITDGPNYKDSAPEISFCNHNENRNDYEGNCVPRLCPLKIKKESYDNWGEWLIDNSVRHQLQDIPQHKIAIIWDNAVRNFKLKIKELEE